METLLLTLTGWQSKPGRNTLCRYSPPSSSLSNKPIPSLPIFTFPNIAEEQLHSPSSVPSSATCRVVTLFGHCFSFGARYPFLHWASINNLQQASFNSSFQVQTVPAHSQSRFRSSCSERLSIPGPLLAGPEDPAGHPNIAKSTRVGTAPDSQQSNNYCAHPKAHASSILVALTCSLSSTDSERHSFNGPAHQWATFKHHIPISR